MADTVIPTIMGIVEAQGGSGEPETVIEALLLLGDVIGESGGAVTYKGTVDDYDDLPNDAEVGDMWNVRNADAQHGVSAGDNVVWNGTSWDVQGNSIDISGMFDVLSDNDIDTLFE